MKSVRRRDEDAERAARRDGARRHLLVVAVFPHLRQGDGAHRRGRGHGGAGHGGEAGAGEDRRRGEPAAPMADPGVGREVGVARKPRHRGEIAHQKEQRQDAQLIAVAVLVGRRGEAQQCRVPAADDADTDETDQPHGNADRHAQRHQHQHDDDAQNADVEVAHLRSRSAACAPRASSVASRV